MLSDLFSQSEAAKVQQKWTYHDLLECIEFQDINIIPWGNPIMEQLVPVFQQVERSRI